MQSLAEERSKLLREIAQLRASAASPQQQPGGVTISSPTGVAHLRVAQAGAAVGASSISPSEAALRSVGSLRAYELALALFFVIFMTNWFWL